MLSIPAAIEQLIKADGTRKNFRVHFPDGDLPDLTNADIVVESVKFTEDVCSGERFRFGSADASTIEFEMVGIPNIIGKTIICVMEYAVPAALQSLYGTWYGIPYGVFTVDSCPRDHKAMTHRKVTAYSQRFTNAFLPELESWKMSRRAQKKWYYMNPYYFLAELGIVTPSTETPQSGTTGTSAYQAYSNVEDGQTVLRRLYGYYPANTYQVFDVTDLDAIYEIGITGSLATLKEILESHHLTITNPVVSATLSITNPNQLELRYHIPLRDNGDGTVSADLIYPQCPQIESGATVKLYIPLTLDIRYTDQNAPANNWTEVVTIGTACTVDKLTQTGTEAEMQLAFGSTLDSSSGYTFYNAYSAAEIISGYAELTGGMVRTNRDGSFEIVYLDNSSPYALTAANVVESAWWDEYIVAPVTAVKYDYVDKSGQQCYGEYSISDDGGSIYDMSGNYILNHLKGATSSYIEGTLLRYLFRPQAGTITFTPLDAAFNGLTYLQPGDAITLTAADGTVIESYILSQTFDGIQVIVQDIQTVQGEVISDG